MSFCAEIVMNDEITVFFLRTFKNFELKILTARTTCVLEGALYYLRCCALCFLSYP